MKMICKQFRLARPTFGFLIAPGFRVNQSPILPILGWITLTPAWAAAAAWTKLQPPSFPFGSWHFSFLSAASSSKEINKSSYAAKHSARACHPFLRDKYAPQDPTPAVVAKDLHWQFEPSHHGNDPYWHPGLARVCARLQLKTWTDRTRTRQNVNIHPVPMGADDASSHQLTPMDLLGNHHKYGVYMLSLGMAFKGSSASCTERAAQHAQTRGHRRMHI